MIIRNAVPKDVDAIVQLLANDPLGSHREQLSTPLPASYHRAFQAIDADPNHELLVVDIAGEVVACLQLNFLQYLTYQGGIRAQIEGVRVREDQRGIGLGEKLMQWAIDRSRKRGAHLVQLTSDKQRPEAIRFYERLGFQATHEGMKLKF